MSLHRAGFVAMLLLSSLIGGSVLQGQSLLTVGAELQVNVLTADRQEFPAVASEPDGDFVVVWQSTGQDGFTEGIFARRFASNGAPKAGEFQVNLYTNSRQYRAAVAANASGFVIVWASQGQDGYQYGVFARRYDSSGTPQAVEFQVADYTNSVAAAPAIAMRSNGTFVVAWHSYNSLDGDSGGVFARRFNASGVALGGDFQINDFTPGVQSYPTVALDGAGDFAIVWQSEGQDGSGRGLFGRRFDSTGARVAAEFQVNVYTVNDQYAPSLSFDAEGGFVVVWGTQDHEPNSAAIARRFDSAGVPVGSEFPVDPDDLEYQGYPRVVSEAAGGFVIAWEAENRDGAGMGIFARRFDSGGASGGGAFQINLHTIEDQTFPALATDGAHRFVVAWGSELQDGSGYGVVARRLLVPAILDIDANGTTAALTDGLLVLRFLFGFSGATLIGGAVDTVNCTRCDATAIAGYLQTLI